MALQHCEFSPREFLLFCDTFKELRRALRYSLRESRYCEEGSGKGRPALLSAWLARLHSEHSGLISDALDLCRTHILPYSPHPEVALLLDKTQADCLREQIEFSEPGARPPLLPLASALYLRTYEASKALSPVSVLRLEIALNAYLFHCEVVQDRKRGLAIAKEAFDSAIPELDNLPEDQYKEVTSLMGLLRDNLTLFTADYSSSEES
uniref:14-3-3 domain-containing protein n=1 Tax=Arcella intermedia TaxID=1963864 RepID=A0A6B2LGB6_9EUKA